MLYALGLSLSTAITFIWLYVRTAIACGKLKQENEGLKKDVEIKTKQLEIAANDPATPADLLKRMRGGSL